MDHFKDQKIEFFNRYSEQLENEKIYGEAFLKWAYGTKIGHFAIEAFVKRILFSTWYGWRMNRAKSREKIMPFIKRFGIDPAEFVKPVEAFESFNEFFSRKLKPESRPIHPLSETVIFPADGRHLGFQNLRKIEGVFVKGQKFHLKEILENDELERCYRHGTAVLSRLCPTDYHRFHFPVRGVPQKAKQIRGCLYSVNPLALRNRLSYLWKNKRMLTQITSEGFGQVLFVEFGATNVGSILQTYRPNQPVEKGEEKGYFEFGASAVMTFFEPERVYLSSDLLENSRRNRELYAHMGDVMGWRL